eukprot:15365142-Alexandrium_andersonii.AAC.1
MLLPHPQGTRILLPSGASSACASSAAVVRGSWLSWATPSHVRSTSDARNRNTCKGGASSIVFTRPHSPSRACHTQPSAPRLAGKRTGSIPSSAKAPSKTRTVSGRACPT